MFCQRENFKRELLISRNENSVKIGNILLLLIFFSIYEMPSFFPRYVVIAAVRMSANVIFVKLILLDINPGSKASAIRTPAKEIKIKNSESCRSLYVIK
ncbi:MAG: hypothetical protein ACD_9C00097G0003 [uncultured bacterium]|nr:MAG: hypothetical protein ACD_9C00097G0003 [uncultured bacterium]